MGIELGPEYYDSVFSTSKNYEKKPKDSIYYNLWKCILDEIHKINPTFIVDIGCGPGHMEEMIAEEPNSNLKKCIGYDFSSVAINKCIAKLSNDNKFLFKIADMTKINLLEDLRSHHVKLDKTLFISLEFIEHITEDLKIIEQVPKNNTFLFSVPSYDSKGHVRFFSDVEQVYARYSNLLNFINVNIMKTSDKGTNVIYICLCRRK